MKTRIVQILFVLACTVLAAALQDLLPSFGGAKPPVLLALLLGQVLSARESDTREKRAESQSLHLPGWLATAVLAGAFEDALSGFPTGCAASFFVLAAIVARLLRPATRTLAPIALGLLATMLAAAGHELWLGMWGVVGDDPSLFIRFFASALPAAPVGAFAFAALPHLAHLAGWNGPNAEGRFL